MAHLDVPSMDAGYLDPKVGRKENLESFTPLMNHVIDYNVWAVKPEYRKFLQENEGMHQAADGLVTRLLQNPHTASAMYRRRRAARYRFGQSV